jgi:hypothetical protein
LTDRQAQILPYPPLKQETLVMVDGLLMKYFVLKPNGDDAYADASRNAMSAYAASIRSTNLSLADDLLKWVIREQRNTDQHLNK